MSGKKLKRLTVAKSSYIYYDIAVIDEYSGQLVFASLVDTDKDLKKISYEINKVCSVYIEDTRRYCTTGGAKYFCDKRKQAKSDFAHLIVSKKDSVEPLSDDNELLTCYTYVKDNEDLNSKIYDKLYQYTSIPLLEEWMEFIRIQMIEYKYLRSMNVMSVYDREPFSCYRIQISKRQLLSIVQQGLQDGLITINNTRQPSDIMECIEGLDSYLNIFGDTLAQRIQESFVPKFDPSKDEYTEYVNNYDDSCYHNGIELYQAQKSVIQAAVNNLNVNKSTFVISEMGTGKTAMGAGIAYAHYGKKAGLTAAVMCPSHLVEKWKREVEKLVPNAKGYIVREIGDLIAIERKIKNKHKLENTFIIISKENAKFSYEMRPSAIWSISKNTFVCPCCGQPLYKWEKVGSGRNATNIKVDFNKFDMLKKLAYNSTCMNKVKKYNTEESKWEEVPCNASLWAPLNKNEKMDWVKLGKSGWITLKHVDDIFNELTQKETLTKKENELYMKLIEVKNTLDNGENLKGIKAPRKYSIAKYIRERFKGHIDYFLCDEMHLFKGGDSKQGQAMADIALASKYFIGLTGTLLNGYADGLFYILFRTVPQLMRKEGLEYNNEGDFMRQYGVVKKTNRYGFRNGEISNKISSQEKPLPGVSPLVFTKFLLENGVFLSLSDMDGGLPAYEEIPMTIPMDDELKQAYDTLERSLKETVSIRGEGGVKAMGSLLQTLSVYPDMPYNQPDVLHPDTNDVLVTPPQLQPGLRNKENAILQLVQEKVALGEKVLIYYEWTNKTDVALKLSNMFKENNIRSVVMTSSVSAEEREEWIENKLEKGLDVLICNPKLVETGLDLLAFTNIVFYQIGYNIFTMRQASRRSWRLSQTEDIKVYFMTYENTIQHQALSLMATKLQASMAIEGKFSEEGLRAMSNNEDLLSQIAQSVVEGIKDTVEVQTFVSTERSERVHDTSRARVSLKSLLVSKPISYSLPYLKRKPASAITNSKSQYATTMRSILSGAIHVGNLI